jgi:hypothetical protein
VSVNFTVLSSVESEPGASVISAVDIVGLSG